MGMALKALLLGALALVGVMGAAEVALAQSGGCNPGVNPHSFACQHETFSGRIFPLLKTTPQTLRGNWRTLVYTPGPQQQSLFRPRVSAKNPRIPVGITNGDGSLVGALSWPNDTQIQFFNFRAQGNHLKQLSRVGLIDAGTAQVMMSNPRERTRELFKCRVFMRARNQHLLCQWFHDQGQGFRFLGYFGWVR